MKKVRISSFAVCSLAFLLGACNTTPPQKTVTESQTQSSGAALSSEIEASLNDLTVADAMTLSRGLYTQAPAAPVPPTLPTAPACVTFDPNPPVDTDADGVPDDLNLTFNCTKTAYRGGTAALTGGLRIQDTAANPAIGLTQTLSNLQLKISTNAEGQILLENRNGTRTLAFNPDTLSIAQDLTVNRQVKGESAAAIINKANLTFTPLIAGTIQRNAPLPDGTISLSGTYKWTSGDLEMLITLSNPETLVFDADCTSSQKIISGKILGTVTSSNYGTKAGLAGIYVQFNGCGNIPTILAAAQL
jgi:hypothetical protein